MKIFIFLLGMAAILSLASCSSEPTTTTQQTMTTTGDGYTVIER